MVVGIWGCQGSNSIFLLLNVRVLIGEVLDLLSAFNWVGKLNLGDVEFEIILKSIRDEFCSGRKDTI